ncbi:Sec-independent protein translocase protein TatB [Oxalicibacterium faecigallinarum]|uniref:Sec-independent protein translocase protein TatB n=1 Tax=Oxalicibacterium faecigallinarum TaxID=573741 RepID=A0A8J3AZ72_9BURK|nr:Sec-independent protein translocase protein TatB [Oxalicibacterium faecigallinarum]GGI19688.1 sec-independent protein translocase protein TatB [Oxalicibacterium faecigallinarum]
MIDIAFSKLAIIGVAALVFIGPERLPKVARMAGTMLGRAQRYINDVKAEVSREMELDELRKMHKDVQAAASDVENTISRNFSHAEKEMHSVWNEMPASDDNPLMEPPTFDQVSEKSRNFRKKKLARTSGLPSWYKRQTGHRSHVISGAARVAKYRSSASSQSRSFFH